MRLPLFPCVWLLCLHVANAQRPEQNAGDFVRILGDGYIHNRDSFTALSCDFQVVVGMAPSWQAVVDGASIDQATVGDGKWRVNGRRQLVTLVPDEGAGLHRSIEDQNHSAAQAFSTPLPFVQTIADGELRLTYDEIMALGTLSDPSNLAPTEPFTPFDPGTLGKKGGPSLLVATDSGDFSSSFDGESDFDGKRALVASITYRGGVLKRTFWLDPERGFLPLKVETRDATGRRTVVFFLTDIRACSDARWFPARSVLVFEPDAPREEFMTRVCEVSSLNVTAPKANEFVLNLPAGTLINDGFTPESQIKLAEGRSVAVEDLKTLVDQVKEHAAQRISMKAERNVPAGRTAWSFFMFASALATATCVLALLYRRRRLNRTTF